MGWVIAFVMATWRYFKEKVKSGPKRLSYKFCDLTNPVLVHRGSTSLITKSLHWGKSSFSFIHLPFNYNYMLPTYQ
jgi:hypothetical protein